MRYSILFLMFGWISGSLLMVPACTDSSNSLQTPLSFTEVKIDKKIGDCLNAEERCLTVKINYPLAIGGVDSVRESINFFFRKAILGSLSFGEDEADLSMSIDSAIYEFGEEFKDFLEDSEVLIPWTIELDGKITFENEKYRSFELSDFHYTGGAHPNTFITKAVFDKSTGKELTIADIVSDVDNFKNLAEAEFRKVRDIDPEMSFQDAGLWFENNEFYLTDNFGLTGEGMELYYNTYEIGPYSLGPTSIIIPYRHK